MFSFSNFIQQSSAHAWLFVPSAILLGALHGLEPGHSKTMMAAFIVAIRGTVGQATMLGLAATVSHTFVVWAIALGGMYLWQGIDAETLEPYFQIASAAIIIAIAVWMVRRTWQEQVRAKTAGGGNRHGHPHDAHGHGHGEEIRHIDTGHGVLSLEIFEAGVPPRWRIRSESGRGWQAKDVTVEIERPNGHRQLFNFVERGAYLDNLVEPQAYLESADEIPEPHAFTARVRLAHGSHFHDYEFSFAEGDGHGHQGLAIASDGYQDAHELAHAGDIRRRFANRAVTNWQIVLFGLTGGLIPGPAAITVVLLCLQLKTITVGAALVLCFSIGLALTLVTVGAATAIGVRHATKRFPWFSTVARRAPYLSSCLIIAVGVYVGINGWVGLASLGHA